MKYQSLQCTYITCYMTCYITHNLVLSNISVSALYLCNMLHNMLPEDPQLRLGNSSRTHVLHAFVCMWTFPEGVGGIYEVMLFTLRPCDDYLCPPTQCGWTFRRVQRYRIPSDALNWSKNGAAAQFLCENCYRIIPHLVCHLPGPYLI